MRRIGRIDAPVDVVLGVLADVEGWIDWMPGVTQVTILESDGIESVLDVHHRQFGRIFRQKEWCRVEPDGLRQRLLEGQFKKWESRWRVVAPPDDEGSAVSLGMEVDPGFVGRLLPSGVWRGILDRLFEECLTGLEKMAEELGEKPEPLPVDDKVLLQVFETDDGLEVWVEGRRFLVES
jgi:ribosome-associated toxin RatA of RatAB toxin-antitoxin module